MSQQVRLVFGGDLDGLEVLAWRCQHAALLRLGITLTNDQVIDTLANNIISWNITHDGKPVPVTREGLLSLDFDLLQRLVVAWGKTVVPESIVSQTLN